MAAKVGAPLTSKYSVQLGYSFNINLGDNLVLFRNATLYQDFDYGVIVDGPEGSGKSVFAGQVACFLDRDHHIDVEKQVCFTPDAVRKAILTLPPGKSIWWDEARRGLNRRRSTHDVNLEMTDLLAECRQNNLFLVIVMPSFYDMDMNVAVWRTRALMHTWYDMDPSTPQTPLRRGYCRFYNEEGKKKLYTNPLYRKSYYYPYLKGDSFEFSFPHHYVVNEEAYRRKKREAEHEFRDRKVVLTKQDVEAARKQGVGECFGVCRRHNLLRERAVETLAHEMGVSVATLYNWDQLALNSSVEGARITTHNIPKEKEEARLEN